MSGWAEAFMTLRVNSKQVKDDVEAGLRGAKGDAAGTRVGGEFSKALGAQSDAGTRTLWQRFTSYGGTQATAAGKDHGQRYGNEFERAFNDTLGRMSKLLAGFRDEEGTGPSLGGRVAGGFGPGLLGIDPVTSKRGLIAGAITGGLAAAPALFAGAGALGAGGLGAGVIGLGAKTLIGSKNTKTDPNAQGPLYDQAQQLQKSFQATMAAAVKPMLEPLKAAMGQIPGILKSLLPQLQAVFAGAGTLIKPLLAGVTDIAHAALPGLAAALKAVAPLLKPLLDGFGQLLKGLLPGLVALLKAAAPAVAAVAQILGGLGKAVGSMLTAFAPAISASSVVLKALGDVVNALFPVIGQLASVFARALAPIFVQLGAAVRALMPFLVLIGKALASLGDVMLGVLTDGLDALVKLLQAIAPALATFAGMLNQIFTVLANKNVFQALAVAVESVVPLIASLINSLLAGLMPILPPLIDFMTKLAGMIAGALGKALAFVIPLLVHLATDVLGAIAKILPVVLPPLLTLIGALGGALGKALVLIVPPLAKMAGILTGALAKILPQLVPPFVAIATTLSGGLLTALVKLIPPLMQLATVILEDLAAILPAVVPLVAALALIFTQALAAVITAVATALAWLITQFSPQTLAALIGIVGGIVALSKAVGLLKTGWALLMDVMKAGPIIMTLLTSPVFLIIAAIALLAFGIFELVKHWSAVWRTIKDVAKDAWDFLTHGWGQFLIPGLTLIRLAVEVVRDHWRQVWDNIKDIAHNFYTWLWTDFGAKIGAFFTKTLPGWWDITVRFAQHLWTGIGNAFVAGWNWVWQHTIGPMLTFFTKTLPGWWNTVVAGVKWLWTQWGNVFRDGWTWIWNHVIVGWIQLITKTIPGWWNTAIAGVKWLWTQWGNIFRDGWTWIYGHTLGPMVTFITKTLPGAFDTGVKALGRFWSNLGGVLKGPANFLIGTVYDAGIRKFWNFIVDHVGLKSIELPNVATLARGGRITAGTHATADDVLARLSRDETVVSAAHSRLPFMQAAFALAGVPGYAAGGIPNPRSQVLPGAGSRLGPVPGVAGVAPALGHDIASAASKLFDFAAMTVDALSGNVTAFANRMTALIGPGAGGAAGDLAHIVAGIPATLVSKAAKFLIDKVAAFATPDASGIPYLGTTLPALSTMIKYFGPLGDPSHETVVPFAGHTVQINKVLAGNVINAGRQVAAAGFSRYIRDVGGFRTSKGASGSPIPFSMHQFGAAMDINEDGGPNGNWQTMTLDPKLVAIMARNLWFNGQAWSGGSRDGGHFQFTGGGGVAGAAGVAGGPGSMSAQAIAALWTAMGGPAYAAGNMARIAFAESGDQPGIIQKGQPPGLTGWGLYQITPTSGISQGGAFGNLLNAANNTRAAISLFRGSGYGPWASDPVGASLVRSGLSYAGGGWINEPVTGVGAYSKALYTFGETGREYVTPEAQMPAASAAAPLIGTYTTAYYGTGDTSEALRELTFTLRRARQGAFFQPG